MKIDIAGKTCFLYRNDDTRCLLVQPVDEHDASLLNAEVEALNQQTDIPYTLVALKVDHWNEDLSPWPAPPVFGREPFGNGAVQTLSFITETLLPELERMSVCPTRSVPCLLGGYSLAGLFALWAGYRSERFAGIAGVSPSVWFPHWLEHARASSPRARAFYLSLGDREERTRHPLMSQVGDAIRLQYDLLRAAGIPVCLQWNLGNHFAHPERRTASGFAWLMNESGLLPALCADVV